jgi:predicted nucleic acid-binding Zn ribbon protein
MECEQCGSVLPEDADACPDCGAEATAPEPKRKRKSPLLVATLVLAFLLLAGAGTAVYLSVAPSLRDAARRAAIVSSAPGSAETTLTADDLDQIAAESAVKSFYEALNTRYAPMAQALVTTDTRSAIDAKLLKAWTTTSFLPARTLIDSDTASVYGHETVRALGSSTLGVKFTLQRVDGAWLVQSWGPVDEGAVSGAVPGSAQAAGPIALTDATASDIVDTLLQAHQVGDDATIAMLTTAAFQKANAAWLNGVDNSQAFTSFAITGVKKKGAAYVVSTTEHWSSKTRTSRYTVVMQTQTILVNGVSQ